jgi:catechol 2,3-dioxygenase-like lactoylglutathione lyase family enzyme
MRWIALGSLPFVLAMLGCTGDRASLAAMARASHDDAEISSARPIFNVRDLAATQRYYRDALGFQLDWEHGDPPNFASVSRADAILFLCEGCQASAGAWIMVFARDVDRLHEEFRDHGASIRMPPQNMPWGIRELHVTDLDGNVIRFGTHIED